MNRHPGFYRVKNAGRWGVAEWDGSIWLETGSEAPATDKMFDEIDDVPVERRVREQAIADVIALIRSERVTWSSGQIDMPVEELVEMIETLARHAGCQA